MILKILKMILMNQQMMKKTTKTNDGSRSRFRIKELYQPPLTNLVNHPEILPYSPSFFNLIPQQINLWMGSSSTNTNNKAHDGFTIDESKPDLGLGKQLPGESPRGTSTGLHHDHADNLYILVLGKTIHNFKS